MSQDYELTKGVALVLVGPEGSGKTTLAFEIAQRYGKVRSVSGFGLNNPIGLRRALRDHPDVLIIDQVPDAKALRVVISLLADKFIDCVTESPGIVLRSNTPNYVICTGSPDALHISRDDRRFHVVEVDGLDESNPPQGGSGVPPVQKSRGRDEIEAENAELRDMLIAAYRELQRHGVKSVPLGYADVNVPEPPPPADNGSGVPPLSAESVHRGTSPTDWRCRCVAAPMKPTDAMIDQGMKADPNVSARSAANVYRAMIAAPALCEDEGWPHVHATSKTADSDGPGEEDGPWAPEWEHRSATSGSATQPHSVPKRHAEVEAVCPECERSQKLICPADWRFLQVQCAACNVRYEVPVPSVRPIGYPITTHEAAPVSQAAWASLDPKEYTPVHNAVLRFLWGTAPYNGLWFHEAKEQARGAFWWRKYLPKPEE